MKTYKYIIEGEEYNVEIAEIKDNIANVVVNGEAYTVEMEQEKEPEKKKKEAGWLKRLFNKIVRTCS